MDDAKPTLIDTSVWIEALRMGGSVAARRAVHRLVEPGLALINPLIRTELLVGARTDQEFQRLSRLLEATTCVPLGQAAWDGAAETGFRLRRVGVTVPTADLVIAASAIEQGAPLLHIDEHFARIAEHSDLDQHRVPALVSIDS